MLKTIVSLCNMLKNELEKEPNYVVPFNENDFKD